MHKFHFLVTLILLLFATGVAADQLRLGNIVAPFYQSIDLRIDPSEDNYGGSTRISVEIRENVDSFRLHADGIKISAVRLGLGGTAIAVSHSIENDILTIAAAQTLAAGKYSLVIEFTNEFNTQAVGLYRMESEGAGYAFTQFEATDARKAFPCFDEPSFKIPYQLNITARQDDTVVTNTPVRSETRRDGWKTLEFGVTRPLPTYLLAIAVGTMDSIEIPNLPVPGRVYTVKGKSDLAKYVAGMVAPILQTQQVYFAMTYPYEKLDLIAIPEYWPGAMEHPGAITFKDSIILFDSKNTSAEQRRNAAKVISHELAHQWFGNLVTMEWWDDLWLNESFGEWMGDKITTELYPETKHELLELRGINGIMASDSLVTSEPIRNPGSTPSEMFQSVGLAYNKGKSVIAMFERWMGEESFRNGVNAYLRENAWGNAQANDFWKALTNAAGADVAESMETFLEQAGVPLVEATIEDDRIRLTQQRFSNYGTQLDKQTWRIPVGLRIGSEGKVIEKTVLLTENEILVEIEGPGTIDWVMPNADGAGYYRWNIGDEAIAAIAPGVDKILNGRERVSFLGNLGALLDAGAIGGDTYMKALGAFANDPEPFVVSAVISELDGVRDTFVTENLTDEFASYLQKTLSPAIERYGINAKPGEEEAVAGFRPRLLYWLGVIAEDEMVVSWASETVARYQDDPSSIDPALAAVAVKIKAKKGDEQLLDQFISAFEAAENPAARDIYLGALGGFEDRAIREKSLRYTLEGPLRPNELFTIPNEIRTTNIGADLIFDWLTTHFDVMTSRMPPTWLPFMPLVGNGCDMARMEKAKVFFAKLEGKVDGTDKQMDKVEASVLDCVGLRSREGGKVQFYLQKL
jgi:alanyl aminopeptidase